jgi:hypothetical protein
VPWPGRHSTARPSRPGRRGPAVAARLESEFLARQRDRERGPFLRARRRGQLPQTTDIDLAIDQLVGPVYYRVLVTRQSVPPQFTDAVVDHYLAGASGH